MELPGAQPELLTTSQEQSYQRFYQESSFEFLVRILGGDWGESWVETDQKVHSLIANSAIETLKLAIPSLILILVLSMFLNLWIFKYRNTWIETVVNEILIFYLSLPILFYAPVIILIFAVHWSLFPLAFLERAESYVLPLLVLISRPTARLSLLFKESLKKEMDQPYVVVLFAKGLSETRILFQHLLKSTMTLWTRTIGGVVIGIFSGSFLVENLFSIPGLGSLFIDALSRRDIPLLLPLSFTMGALFIFLNLFLEGIQEKVDPRRREKGI